MRVAWLTGPRTFELGELDDPLAGPGEVVVDVIAWGVCGSNLHDYATGPRWLANIPGANGHEVSAVVSSVGDGVDALVVGDVVVVEPSGLRACRRCPACHDGATWF